MQILLKNIFFILCLWIQNLWTNTTNYGGIQSMLSKKNNKLLIQIDRFTEIYPRTCSTHTAGYTPPTRSSMRSRKNRDPKCLFRESTTQWGTAAYRSQYDTQSTTSGWRSRYSFRWVPAFVRLSHFGKVWVFVSLLHGFCIHNAMQPMVSLFTARYRCHRCECELGREMQNRTRDVTIGELMISLKFTFINLSAG